MENALLKQIDKLNKSEKLLLIESIWDSIASDSAEVPLTDHHKAVLEERLRTLEEDTEKGTSWTEFRKNYL